MNSPTEKNARQEKTSGFQQDLEYLRQIPLFQNLDYECLKLLAMLSRKVEVIEGDQLMVQGEDDGSACLLINGKLESFHEDEGTRYLTRSYEPGQFIGSVALFGVSIRLFSVVAVEKSIVLRINRDGFQKVMQKFPDMIIRVAANLTIGLVDWERAQLTLAEGRIRGGEETSFGISLL